MFDKDMEIKGLPVGYMEDLINVAGFRKFFPSMYEIYSTGIVIGLYYGLKEPEKKEYTGSIRIFADKVIKERESLMFLYRLVMLIDSSSTSMSEEEKINLAFEKELTIISENMNTVNEYARAGIIWLYKNLVESKQSSDVIKVLYEMFENFKYEEYDGDIKLKLS